MARPTRSNLAQELDDLVRLMEQNPQGMTRVAIEHAYAEKHGRALTERTLRRRLEVLVAGGRLAVTSEAAMPTYRAQDATTTVSGGADDDLPLTASGLAVRALIRRPMTQRPPVGYDREFLDAYLPGESWYLPSAMRRRLYEMGRTPGDDRPADTFARDILSRLLIDLSWASSRLEGNTYSRLDTQNLIEFGQQAEGRDTEETQMILNHKTAIELLVAEADAPAFPPMLLRGLHAALSENLMGNPADEGRLRTRVVDITGTSYTPIAIPQVIAECSNQILENVQAITDPFEQAFFLMVHIPYLQPFVDVNKRTSRLAANWPLLHSNLCPLSFIDVPERAYVEGTLAVYETRRVDLLRDVFAWAYERSCAQYHVVRNSLPQPDALRLHYRTELRAVVLKWGSYARGGQRLAWCLKTWTVSPSGPWPNC
jgi:hypothetical protein